MVVEISNMVEILNNGDFNAEDIPLLTCLIFHQLFSTSLETTSGCN